jgi:lipoate-protein ligase A
VLFYVNQPSLIIGKHQNTIEEINADYVSEHEITVVRRISGGGTVYHDLGNLNFSFMTPFDAQKVNNFAHFTAPIVRALQALGIEAEMTGRNDIVTADGRKISGNAQFSTSQKMFSHGTLLFNSDMSRLGQALRVRPDKIESKGIKSVRSRVANILSLLPKPMSLGEFKTPPLRRLTPQEWKEVHALAHSKYFTWEWNYGKSPAFNIQKTHRFDFGQIDARLHIKNGKITNLKFYGDFLSIGNLAEVEHSLTDCSYNADALAQALAYIDLEHYFGPIKVDEFVRFLC